MAERYYTAASGNWSTTANWDGGATLPGASDDVYANGKTITIDQDITVLSLRTTAGTTAVAGGGFTCSTARTITATGAGVVAGSSTCLTFTGTSGTTLTLAANVTGASSGGVHGAVISSTGTLNITGNVTGGSGSGCAGAQSTSTGTLNITGNVTGGSNATARGAWNFSTGTLNITGNVTGGSNATAAGVYNQSTGAVTITGNLVPASAPAFANVSTGRLTLNGNMQSVSTGVNPYGTSAGLFTIDPSATLSHAYRVYSGGSVGSERTLSTSGGSSSVAGSRIFGGF